VEMTNKLEKVFELFLNDQQKEANALLHEWFVEKAREVHQQLVEEEDSVFEDELTDEMSAESFYEDKEGEEGEEGEETADAEFELSAELDAGDEVEGDEVEGDEGLEDRVEDLEAELEALKAEFESMMGDEEGEMDDMGDMEAGEEGEMDDMGDMGDMEAGDEGEVEEALGDGKHGTFDGEQFVQHGFGDDDGIYEEEVTLDEDEFADLEESALSMLQAVKSQNTEAHVGAAASQKLPVNSKSPIPQHAVDKRVEGATPHNRKDVEFQGGFKMETPPTTKQGTGAKNPHNVEKKAKAPLHSVKQEGDASAMINKVEGGKGNTDSPVPTNKGKVTKP
jgi:hypothetical protein